MPNVKVDPSPTAWRTVDIVVAAVLAVAFGVVFWAWNLAWSATDGVFTFFPPAQAVMYGVWLIPAVLASLIIRKAGAGVFTEALAATFSALLGSQWGVMVIWQGLVQGAAGELPFALGRYRRFGTGMAVAAGFTAGLGAGIWDAVAYYSTTELWSYRVPYVLLAAASAALIAGLGSVALTRALAGTGVLDRFPSGRDRALI